jgi:hypothetical protein
MRRPLGHGGDGDIVSATPHSSRPRIGMIRGRELCLTPRLDPLPPRIDRHHSGVDIGAESPFRGTSGFHSQPGCVHTDYRHCGQPRRGSGALCRRRAAGHGAHHCYPGEPDGHPPDHDRNREDHLSATGDAVMRAGRVTARSARCRVRQYDTCNSSRRPPVRFGSPA